MMAQPGDGKKAVVFGGSGFLGSHVADALTDDGWSVTVFDKRESPWLREGQKMVVGDVLDVEALRSVLENAAVVFNFAGVADIEDASDRPLDTIRYNVLGNALILEELKDRKDLERYVFASTLYVYSDVGSFYRDSKVACELYIHDYGATYGVPFTVLRFGSVYGPRSYHKDRIWKFVHQALTEHGLSYGGDGEEIREYIHVQDAARCAVEVLEPRYEGQNVILSGNQSMKIKDLMVMVREILGEDFPLRFDYEKSAIHYEVTPYSFNPRLGKRYISSSYIDLGEGIMQCAEEIHNQLGRRLHEDAAPEDPSGQGEDR